MAIARSLKNYLEEQGVQYDVVRHVHTESSTHTAAEAHVPGDRVPRSRTRRTHFWSSFVIVNA